MQQHTKLPKLILIYRLQCILFAVYSVQYIINTVFCFVFLVSNNKIEQKYEMSFQTAAVLSDVLSIQRITVPVLPSHIPNWATIHPDMPIRAVSSCFIKTPGKKKVWGPFLTFGKIMPKSYRSFQYQENAVVQLLPNELFSAFKILDLASPVTQSMAAFWKPQL